MVIGQYSGNVGVGNRVSFPRRFRSELGNRLFITKGLDGNLIIVSESQKQLLIEGIDTRPYATEKDRRMQTFVLGNTFEIELDSLNRFVIPSALRTYATITKEVIFAGVENYVQVWDKKRWEDYQRSIYPLISRDAEKLPGNE